MIDSTSLEALVREAPPDERLESLVTGFKALGDPTRLSIVAVLSGGTRCVCEIQAAVDVPPNLLSHHLKVLRDAGLIRGDRRGRWIDYSLQEGALAALQGALPPGPAALGIDLAACDAACARADGQA